MLVKVETYLYDGVEHNIFAAAMNEIADYRQRKQAALGGSHNAAPGQRETEPLGSEKAAALASVEATVQEPDAAAETAAKATRAPRKKKAEVVAAIAPEAPAAVLEGDEAPMRPQTHGGALKSGGAPAPKKEETEVVVSTVAVVSIDDARSKLQSFAEKNGLPAASKLLAEFGAKRIGDVPTNRLGAFVARLA